MMTKQCTKCHETKNSREFYLRRVNNGAPCVPFLSPECKMCTRARSERWRVANLTTERKAVYNRAATAKRARIKDAVFGAYGGYRCACCGETERAFLTLDHVNNDGAKMRREMFGSRTYAGYRTYSWLASHSFPAGYQVLCMNCNHGKRMNDGVCPHQQAKRNDHPLVGVEPSGSKRIAPAIRLVG